MLEHDPHWRESVQRMIELVKPGGTLIITCAAPGRGEHELACSPERGVLPGDRRGGVGRPGAVVV